MESSFNMFVSVFLLSCVLLPYAQGLQCHVCNTANDNETDCESIPDSVTKFLKECTENEKTCRIQHQWVDFSVLNQTHGKRTIRQCAFTEYDSDRPCYYRAGFGGKVNVCHCNFDACNEASTLATSLAALVLSAVLMSKVL